MQVRRVYLLSSATIAALVATTRSTASATGTASLATEWPAAAAAAAALIPSASLLERVRERLQL